MSNIDKFRVYYAEKATSSRINLSTTTRGIASDSKKNNISSIKRSVTPNIKKIDVPTTPSDAVSNSTKIMVGVAKPAAARDATPIITRIDMNVNRLNIKGSGIAEKHISGHTCVDFESRKMKNSYKALNKKLGED